MLYYNRQGKRKFWLILKKDELAYPWEDILVDRPESTIRGRTIKKVENHKKE
jgi:hypothetical protein